MTTLVLGATGQVGRGVVRGLAEKGVAVRAAARRPLDDQVRFDWKDPSTYADALRGVEVLHLLPPQGDPDPLARITHLLGQARDLRRVAVLSSSAIEDGDPGLGQVPAALRAAGLEHVVLRPSWFMQNFTGHHQQAQRIREHDEIVTATGDGRVGFIDTADIAAVSVAALTGSTPHAEDLVLTGPEALSYDDVAALVTAARGRPVRHRHVDEAAFAHWLSAEGISDSFAAMLAGMDARIAGGAEDRVTDTVERMTGRAPTSMAAHLERNLADQAAG